MGSGERVVESEDKEERERALAAQHGFSACNRTVYDLKTKLKLQLHLELATATCNLRLATGELLRKPLAAVEHTIKVLIIVFFRSFVACHSPLFLSLSPSLGLTLSLSFATLSAVKN